MALRAANGLLDGVTALLVLAGGGIALVAVGVWLSRKRRHDA